MMPEQTLYGLNVQLRILKAGLREGAKDPDIPRLIKEKEAEVSRLSAQRPYCCGKPMQPNRECENCGCTLSDEWNAALGGIRG